MTEPPLAYPIERLNRDTRAYAVTDEVRPRDLHAVRSQDSKLLMQDGARLYRSFMSLRGRVARMRVIRLSEELERQEQERASGRPSP